MSRNQKATVLTGGFYILGILLFIWGGMLNPETRISGTINKRPIDIPAWLQNEPEYKGKIQNAKVTGGWGGGRLILWFLGVVAVGTGATLSAERQAELEEERRLYEIEQQEKQAMRKQEAAYNVSIDRAIKQRTGTARLAIVQDQLLEQIDEIRYENGWVLPDEPPKTIAPPVLKNELPPLKSPAEYAAEIAARVKAETIGKGGIDEGDKGEITDAKTGDKVPDDRKKFYQDKGEKIMRSLAALKMSILSAAPTGAGKTHTLYRYLSDLKRLYPDNDLYVIAHKYDSFLGLLEAGRVTIFDDLNPEASLDYLDIVYAEMKRRLGKPEHERAEFEKKPVRLILDDWFASFGVLKNNPALWAIVKTKIGAIITKGREANVCLYIATQSFNLEALGIQDSNIRGNLAITCQGLVTEKLDEYGDLVEQGNYESLQLLINNSFIVSAKQDRERLNAELDELVALSRLHQVPALFSAVGKPTVALAPYYEKPTASVAVLDRNDGENGDDELPEFTPADVADFRARLQTLQPSDSPEKSPSDGSNNENACNAGSNEVMSNDVMSKSNAGSNAGNDASNWELESWFKWLPSKSEVIEIMEQMDATTYNFAYLVKTKLKKTEAIYNRKAKGAIVRLLIDSERFDLIEKFDINPALFPFID